MRRDDREPGWRLHTGAEMGYTLMELLIVLLALSVMTIAAAVRLRPAVEHAKVNSAASVMASDLQYAQLMAAKGRKPVVVILTVATQQYMIRDRANSALIHRTRYLGADTDYDLDSLSGTATTLSIFPTGVTSATRTFTLGLNGYTKQVKFTKAGQIRVIGGPSRKNEGGVGLVEILVALTILSVVMMSLGGLMFQVARGTRQAAQSSYRSAAIHSAGAWAQTLPWDSIATNATWGPTDTIGEFVFRRYMAYADSTKYKILTVIIRPDSTVVSSSRIRPETVTVVRVKPLRTTPLQVR